jgi:ATP-dependent Lon protease
MNVKIQNNNVISIILNIDKKIMYFQHIIQKTALYIQENKKLNILDISDINNCMDILTNINVKLLNLKNTINTNSDCINILQTINNDLSSLFKLYGTENLDDLLGICFGTNSLIVNENEIDINKYELLKKYFHPTSYKVVNNKSDIQNKISGLFEHTLDKSNNMECYDIGINIKSDHVKIHGIKLYIYNSNNKSILITGFMDDVILDFLNNTYILLKKNDITLHLPNEEIFKGDAFKSFVNSLILKDYLIYNYTEIYNKYVGYLTQLNCLKQKTISQTIKDFTMSDLFSKRLMLTQLLIKSDNYENQYLAYLLYDILSNDTAEGIDTYEQNMLFNSFSWSLKQYFKNAMKNTIQYTHKLSNVDLNKIPLEQQICLLKTCDSVKEKAMLKLKEIKSKSEDSCYKARQYLEALLKIPFNIYRKEPILNLMDIIRRNFNDITKNHNLNIQIKEKYTNIEIIKYITQIEEENNKIYNIAENKNNLQNILLSCEKTKIIQNIILLNEFIIKHKIKYDKLKYSNKSKNELKKMIIELLEHIENTSHELFKILFKLFNNIPTKNNDIIKIKNNLTEITDYIADIKITLDNSVYGHDLAKKQIERIIGQWINGEHDGYCFGFEGPPGVGKTSLAKYGISNCLKDEYGNKRPFSMIQMGGDSNGSTIHGHNYTYVGSSWGSIVQILIDTKCMNPIIFIDEVDKISKTESGKEIIGILTHLLDSTQNDCFQDKYFSGIDLDLSKVLFILSYNDVDSIDKVLLDRIHRIKFGNLSLEDKLIISNTHILPEIYIKMGLEGVIFLSDKVIKYIIKEYTCEPGVRKLKETFFEIIGEINIYFLKNCSVNIDLPITITIEDIKTKYFKHKQEVRHQKIHNKSKIGTICGLWANSLGRGGTLPIQATMFPSQHFLDLKLTGSQGVIMKESMNVALTMAWNLTEDKIKEQIKQTYKEYGVHVHCPDCSTPKDGPSALSAITIVIYSLFNSKKIKNYIGITGEMTMDGDVTEIGGLDLKILGGISAGVKEFIFPYDNKKDFDKFMEKYKDTDLIKDILFHPVNNIHEILQLIFEE